MYCKFGTLVRYLARIHVQYFDFIVQYTYNVHHRARTIQHAAELLLSGGVSAGVGIRIVKLGPRCLAVGTVAPEATCTSGFRNFAAAVL